MFVPTTSHLMISPTADQSSDSTDPEPRRNFPDIFTLMMNRGIVFESSQMDLIIKKLVPVHEPSMPVPQIPKTAEIPIKADQVTPIQPSSGIKKRKESKRTLFTDHQRSVLMHWLKEHQSNPYPTSSEKQELMEKTGLNRDQVNVWFTNNRVRHGMSCSSHNHNKNSRSNMFYH